MGRPRDEETLQDFERVRNRFRNDLLPEIRKSEPHSEKAGPQGKGKGKGKGSDSEKEGPVSTVWKWFHDSSAHIRVVKGLSHPNPPKFFRRLSTGSEVEGS